MPNAGYIYQIGWQFSSEINGRPTTFPAANITLEKSFLNWNLPSMTPEHEYRVALQLELPDSFTNRNLGMFMCNIHMYSLNGQLVDSAKQYVTLKYRSIIVRMIKTFFLAPLYVFALKEEKITTRVVLFEKYVNYRLNPAVLASIVIENSQIQIYKSTLKINARYTGLKYLIYEWPLTTAFYIIIINAMSISFFLFSIWFCITACLRNKKKSVFTTYNKGKVSSNFNQSKSFTPHKNISFDSSTYSTAHSSSKNVTFDDNISVNLVQKPKPSQDKSTGLGNTIHPGKDETTYFQSKNSHNANSTVDESLNANILRKPNTKGKDKNDDNVTSSVNIIHESSSISKKVIKPAFSSENINSTIGFKTLDEYLNKMLKNYSENRSGTLQQPNLPEHKSSRLKYLGWLYKRGLQKKSYIKQMFGTSKNISSSLNNISTIPENNKMINNYYDDSDITENNYFGNQSHDDDRDEIFDRPNNKSISYPEGIDFNLYDEVRNI